MGNRKPQIENVVVTARAFWVSGQEAHDALEAAGCRVTRSPRAGPLTEDELIEQLADIDAIVASSDPFTTRVFRECPRLKIVSRCGVGYDSVDVPAATEAGVIVTTTPGAMTDAVADYAFGLMLSVARRIPEGDALMRSGGWGEFPGVLVVGKTLGIVGLGQIGKGIARRAAGFDMRILAFDPAYPSAPPGLPPLELTSLERLLAESDFVSLSAPNTPETRGMFDAARFAQMKRTAYFVNTARGALVDESALVEALERGTIAGAAIDVYQQEPLPTDHPLRRAPNLVRTPHNAFNAVEAAAAMSYQAAQNVLAVKRSERPPGLLNPNVIGSQQLRSAVLKSAPSSRLSA